MLKPGQFGLADSELNEVVPWYWQGDATLGLGRSSESVCINWAMDWRLFEGIWTRSTGKQSYV